MRGLGNGDRRRMHKDMTIRSRAEVILIQKSKLEVDDMRVMRDISIFAKLGWVSIPSIGAAGGVIILWDRDRIEEVEHRMNRFSATLTVVCKGENQRSRVFGVYGPTNDSSAA